MRNNALYYPYIEFRDAHVIKAMALYYDRIYRIAPSGFNISDPEELRPLTEDGMIGGVIDPVRYSSEAADNFLKAKDSWDAAALTATAEEERDIAKIHRSKMDTQVRNLFRTLGYGEDEGWMHVPTELASNYMLYLAMTIGKRNNLELVTDEWAPWTATNYFAVDGKVDGLAACYDPTSETEFALYCYAIRQLTPLNIEDIPANKIAEFRIKRKDEIKRFRDAVSALHGELCSIEDPSLRRDKIKDGINELDKAQKDYHKSADLIKATEWGGFLLTGFPATLELGKMLGMGDASTMILAASAVAIGGIVKLSNHRKEIAKAIKENPASAIVSLASDFKQYTGRRDGGDVNFYAYNCLEEYVND